MFRKDDSRLFKKRYLTTSHQFFQRNGSKILVISPFIGVVRTYTPVVAGASTMRYSVFLSSE